MSWLTPCSDCNPEAEQVLTFNLCAPDSGGFTDVPVILAFPVNPDGTLRNTRSVHDLAAGGEISPIGLAPCCCPITIDLCN